MSVLCGACGGANRDDARFCADCGAPLVRRCAACDRELRHSKRFCDGCGAPVADVAAAPAAASGARKLVTVLFADLVGSTTIQESMDPEAVRTTNDRAYAQMSDAVERHGGTVVKFVGDGMMAAFGVPEVAEDDAARALAAAVELRAVFEASMRIGVNTGEVVVAEGDTDVVGDTVNVAARLEHDAPTGGVLVGPETYRLTRDVAVFEEPHDLLVKGRAAPVEARVLVELAASTAPQSPFVGREGELASLVGALGTAEATNRARLVTLIGSPGVGKSRLLAELHRQVTDTATVLSARCFDTGTSSLEPIAEIVRQAVATAGGVDRLPIDGADQQRVAAVLDALAGGTPGTPQEMFWGVRRLVEATAQTKPVLLTLDDLHWAEPVLLDLVEHLAEWLSDAPVVLVAAGRPELREQRPSLAETGVRSTLVVSLEGLPAEATERLAVDLLGAEALPALVVSRIVDATGGNPLFVRETLRMLVDDGVLRGGDGSWQLAVDVDDIELPSTINALLAARIDRLPAEERTVLERASVLGQDVVRGALDELIPAAVRPRLAAILESLRRKELLEPAGDYWIDEPLLRFHHALVRDAAYRRVLKAARAELHELAARWLSAKTGDGDEHDELIGFHLEQSHLSRRDLAEVDDETDPVAVDAGTRLGRVATRALDRDDLPAAAALSGRALVCLPTDHLGRSELLLVRCEALLDAGDIAPAVVAVDELENAGETNERLDAWATVFRIQLDTLTGTADLADAEKRAASAAGRLASLHDSAGAAKAHRVRAMVLARAGRIGDTEAALDLALTAARDADDRRQISGVLAAAPLAALWGPSPVPRAGGRCLDVVRLLRITTGAREVEAVSTRCQAMLEALRGRSEAAHTMLDRARAVLEDLGSRRGLVELDLYAGMVELTIGDPSAAAPHLRRAHDGFTAMGVAADAAQAAAFLSRALLLSGDEDAALALADDAARVGDNHLKTAVTWRAVKAQILARRSDHEEALKLLRSAVTRAEPTDALIDHADALAAFATVLRETGDADGAWTTAEQARSLYEAKGASALAARLAFVTEQRRTDPSEMQTDVTLATRTSRALDACLVEGRWDDFAALFRNDFVMEDRRKVATEHVLDAARTVESALYLRDFDVRVVRTDVIAARGDRLALHHRHAGGIDFQIEWLMVDEVDEQGRPLRSVQFDPDDLEAALAELDRMARVRSNRAVAVASAMERCIREERWEDLKALWHPRFSQDDRRTSAVIRDRDRAAIMESAHAIHDQGLDTPGKVLETRGDSRALFHVRQSNDQFAVEFLFILEADESGRARRGIVFDVDAVDAARQELDRLTSASPTPNLATRTAMAMDRAFREQRWDEYERLWHPDCAMHDRRAAMRMEQREWAGNHGAAVREVISSARYEIAETRGEQSALFKVTWGNGNFTMEYLFLIQVDDAGRAVRCVHFEVEHADQARAELDRLAAPTPAPNLASRVADAMRTAIADRRWDDFQRLWHPDLVFEDRRPIATIHHIDIDDIGTAEDAIESVFPNVTGEVLATRGEHAALLRVREANEHFGDDYLFAFAVDDSGRVVRALQLPPENVELALDELDRLQQPEPRVTLASVAYDLVADLMQAGQWDVFRCLAHPEFVHETRRPLIAEPNLHVGDVARSIDVLAELGLRLTAHELVAVRGEHLVLTKQTFSGDANVFEGYTVGRVDDHGRLVESFFFAGDDHASALAELERLAHAHRAARHPDVTPNCAALLGRIWMVIASEGRVEDLAVLTAESYRSQDRQAGARLRHLDRDATIESGALMANFGATPRIDTIATRGDRWALIRQAFDSDGFKSEMLNIVGCDGSNRVVQTVQFDLRDLDAALAELDRLAESDGVPKNRASQLYEANMALIRQERWEDLAAAHHPNYVLEDRSSGPKLPLQDVSLVVGSAETAPGLWAVRHHEVVATRGESLVLVRQAFGTEDFENEILSISQFDPTGLCTLVLVFEPDDLDAAVAELDRLARAS